MLKDIENLVFVGGFAMFMHGLKSSYKDLDIVITDPADIPDATEYATASAHSLSGKRAFLHIDNQFIDIFIEDKLPQWELIDGLKVQTVPSMLEHYERVLAGVGEKQKTEIIYKINTLKAWQDQEKI